jgi:dTDP-4-amino-4,6-dideoxygalactose transaminase
VIFIGGFFGVELPTAHGRGLDAFWSLPSNPALQFANARSALAALLASARPARLWLPAYVCQSVAQAAAAAATPVSYFPVDESLQPEVRSLRSAARSGEMILALDYFGRAPHAEFLDFVRQRDDLLFVEDACHAVDTGVAQWGRWCLRSPRKLIGVPDGGFLAPGDGIAAARCSIPKFGLDTYQAACLRFEDENEQANPMWHAANQGREAAEAVSARRMSRLSRELMARLPVEPIAERRRANFRVLAGLLPEHRYLPDEDPAFVPVGFPVRLRAEIRDRVRADLIASGIFPALHWNELPSPSTFRGAHRLATELLTLPCDQRYAPIDMQRVARILTESLNRQ